MAVERDLYWYNYRTGNHDALTEPQTDEQAEQYVPQDAGVNMYRLLRTHYGLSILESMVRVLSIVVGEPVEPLEEKS